MKSGDIVRKKGHLTRMTVKCVRGIMATCQWFDEMLLLHTIRFEKQHLENA